MPAMLAELFPVQVRYTGGVGLLSAGRADPAPGSDHWSRQRLVATAGGTGVVAGYVVVTCAVSLVGLAGIRETAHRGTGPPGRRDAPCDHVKHGDHRLWW